MKRIKLLVATLLLSFSCFAQQSIKDIPNVNGNCMPGQEIKSHFAGEIINKPAKLPEALKKSFGIKASAKYYFDGEYRTSEYEVLYVDVELNTKNKTVKKGDVIGTASGNQYNITIRSKIIDPYLVGCSNILPKKIDGYYYFLPGMLLSNVMKYFEYMPLNDDELFGMYKHVTEPEENDEDWAPGVALFEWHNLVETTLSEYPAKVESYSIAGVPIESAMLIDYKGIKLRLNFQRGFLDYLKNEYKLNDKIYLYLVITSMDYFSKEVDCYVRDFSLKSPTEIVKQNIKIVEERVK